MCICRVVGNACHSFMRRSESSAESFLSIFKWVPESQFSSSGLRGKHLHLSPSSISPAPNWPKHFTFYIHNSSLLYGLFFMYWQGCFSTLPLSIHSESWPHLLLDLQAWVTTASLIKSILIANSNVPTETEETSEAEKAWTRTNTVLLLVLSLTSETGIWK